MSNFFGEIAHRVGDLVSYPVKASKDLITHPKKGIKEFEHLYTHNEHEDQQLFQQGFGIHGWVGKHPQEFAGAVVATIFGGWAAAGAYGGSAAAGATGAAGSTAGGTGIAAGTAIGQTVPATPGMIAASSGGGSAIGFGANAASAGYAATAGTGTSYSVLAGSTYGADFGTTLGGEASVGNTGLSSGSTWFDKAKDAYNNYNRVKQLTQSNNQQGQQAAQPTADNASHALLAQFLNKQSTVQGGQMTAAPQLTTPTVNTNTFNATDFSNQFGG